MPDPFGMRWFGIYTLCIVLCAVFGVMAIHQVNGVGVGVGTLLGQIVFILIGVCPSQFSQRYRQWMLGRW